MTGASDIGGIRPGPAKGPPATRIRLEVPFGDNKLVKRLGGKFDVDLRSWYVPDGLDPVPFGRWMAIGAAAAPAREEKRPEADAAKLYLSVPHSEKDQAAAMGAKWDPGRRAWYAPEGVDAGGLRRWMVDRRAAAHPARTYLEVPFAESGEAAARGAKFDREGKGWYVSGDSAAVAAWLPTRPLELEDRDPRREFVRAMLDHGLLAASVEADGKIHRVPVLGDKPGCASGAYLVHLDGVPNGWFQNHKTDPAPLKWTFTGQRLAADELVRLRAEASERRRDRERDRSEAMRSAAKRFSACSDDRAADLPSHPYLARKGIRAPEGVLYRRIAGSVHLQVPGYFYGSDGLPRELRTIQGIAPDGSKRFERGCPKAGACFLVQGAEPSARIEVGHRRWVEGGSDPGQAPFVLVAEGLATAKSLLDCTGLPVVCAFDSGNLKPAAERIKEAFPGVALVFCSDHDHKRAVNPGLFSASEAAAALGGFTLIPPLTGAQKSKGLTDFNDLVSDSGPESVSYFLACKLRVIRRALQASNDHYRAHFLAVESGLHDDLACPGEPEASDFSRGVF